jgi:hypothetical protein
VKFTDAIMLLGSVEKYAFDHNWIPSVLVFWLCRHFCLIDSAYDYYIILLPFSDLAIPGPSVTQQVAMSKE